MDVTKNKQSNIPCIGSEGEKRPSEPVPNCENCEPVNLSIRTGEYTISEFTIDLWTDASPYPIEVAIDTFRALFGL